MGDLKNVLKNKELIGSGIAIDPTYAMKQLLVKMKNEINSSLPSGTDAERFQRSALTAFNYNEKIKSCEPMTFIAATIQCAQLGLEANTPLGHAYIIPQKINGVDKVAFVIGYKGLLELAHRSKRLKTLYAHEVCENDEFDIDYGLVQKLTHKPLLRGNRGEVIGYYAVYHLEPSGYNFVFMAKDEVINHGKKYSKEFNGGLWEREFDSMAKKTVIKKLLKYAPLTTEINKALVFDGSIKNSIDKDMLHVKNIEDNTTDTDTDKDKNLN